MTLIAPLKKRHLDACAMSKYKKMLPIFCVDYTQFAPLAHKGTQNLTTIST